MPKSASKRGEGSGAEMRGGRVDADAGHLAAAVDADGGGTVPAGGAGAPAPVGGGVTEPAAQRRSSGPQRSDASHRAILEAAEALLAEAGPSGVTFEAVARRAKAGKPTIYRWWPTKAALLLEVYERHKGRVMTAPDLGDFRRDLVAFTRQLWRFWRETSGGTAFAALIAEAQSDTETRRLLVEHFSDDARSPLTPLIERAIGRGDLPAATTVRTVRDAIMAVYWYRLITGRLDEAEIETSVDQLLVGLLPRR